MEIDLLLQIIVPKIELRYCFDAKTNNSILRTTAFDTIALHCFETSALHCLQ